MIHIFVGNDTKKIIASQKALIKNTECIILPESAVSEALLLEHASAASLFGDSPIIVIDNALALPTLPFNKSFCEQLRDSPTLFIFRQEKLLAVDIKKYQKYATIEIFGTKPAVQKPVGNAFQIVDAFASHDKIKTWVLYRQAIDSGVEPESISGMFFWKIKTMILRGDKSFPVDSLRKQSSAIVSLYHRAHRGECDMAVGLEQFILTTLSK